MVSGYNSYSDSIDGYNSALAHVYPYQDGSTYGRPGFDRFGYEDQRCAEKIPTRHDKIMREAARIYDQVGLVRTMIDLITDFTICGLRVVHPQQSTEQFYQNWFSRVGGLERSERFMSNFFKFGNVIVRRKWATLGKRLKKNIRQSKATDVDMTSIQAPLRKIPSRYVFYNPEMVEILSPDLSKFVGPKSVLYGIRIPTSLKTKFSQNEQISSEIDPEIKQALSKNGLVDLPKNDTLVFHYKKDDWEEWAKPLMYGVFADIYALEKLKIADLTALDGATERVRIYKLGSMEHKILPDVGAFSKLNELLRVNAGAGTRNLVWGPDIDLIESNTDSHLFLGKAKYEPTLAAIYAGLGIPPTLTGTDTGGTTNNLISLKTLIKRLEYGRQRLIEFWNVEFELVRQVMGFQKAAVLEFDQNNLGDEEAEKRLFIELADRDIIPVEVVQRKFGVDPQVNSSKVETEASQRKEGKRVRKASPFHNAQYEDQLKKSLLDRGQVTPTEVGLKLEPRGNDTTNLNPSPNAPSNPDQPKKLKKPNGRPPQKKDEAPRKQRRFTPVIKAEEFWANEAFGKIAEILNPLIMERAGKKNMRSLTSTETEDSERLKAAVFFNVDLFANIDQGVIQAALRKPFPSAEYNEYKAIAKEVQKQLKRELTFSELHSIQIGVYLDGKN